MSQLFSGLALFTIFGGWIWLMFKATRSRKNFGKQQKETSKHSWHKMLILSKAFHNIQEQHGGKVIGTDENGMGQRYDYAIPQEELDTEYAKLMGMVNCPCQECIGSQRPINSEVADPYNLRKRPLL